MGTLVRLAAMAIIGALPAAARADDEPDFVTIGGGGFDVNDNETAAQFELQFRLNNRFWIFKPQVGLFITSEAAAYAYFGILTDVFFGRRLWARRVAGAARRARLSPAAGRERRQLRRWPAGAAATG